MGPDRHDKTKILATFLIKWWLRAPERSAIQETLTPEMKLQAPRSNVKFFCRWLKFLRDALWIKSNKKKNAILETAFKNVFCKAWSTVQII